MIRSTLLSVPFLALGLVSGCERGPSDDSLSERGDDVPPCSSVTLGECGEEDDGAAEEDEGGEDSGESSGDEGEDTEGCDESGEHEDTDTDTDGDEDTGEGEADLPYDIEADIGDTVDLMEAFAEKGPLPQAILSVEMDGGDGEWRLMELQSGTPFVVDQSDCDHEGNRDTGRDRILVTWQNPDGSEATDHIDLRYCGA